MSRTFRGVSSTWEWAVSGDVVITFTNTGGPNAVLNGIFFDPSGGGSNLPAGTASFVQSDTTTSGNWIGVYGSQGYNIIAGPTDYPAYATVTSAGESESTWSTNASDPRALQTPGSTARVAAAWYTYTSFTVDIDLTDGQTHDITLYALDYDDLGRSEQIQFTSAITGAVLSTESIANFSGGIYLEWAVSGDVVITFTNTGGPNAVLNGIFFDPPGGGSNLPAGTASFVQSDTTTEGNWIGVYGTQGYNIIAGPTDYPTYATVTPAGQFDFTWSTDTSAPGALQTPGSTARVAAGWFSNTSFTVDVDLTDGQTHDISLYALDYDNEGRSEQIQFTSASTGAVLSTESIANFSGGVYLEWAVSGDVVITFTNTGGPNAVLNGIFFDPGTASPGAIGNSAPAGGNDEFRAPEIQEADAVSPINVTGSDSHAVPTTGTTTSAAVAGITFSLAALDNRNDLVSAALDEIASPPGSSYLADLPAAITPIRASRIGIGKRSHP